MGNAKGTAVTSAADGHGVAARVTRHRFRAIVDDVLAGLLGPGARVDAKGRDLVTRLQDECLSDDRTSSAALAELLRLVPVDTAASAPTAAINFNNLYHLAVQQAQPVPLVVIDEPGYIEGTAVDKPLITQEEW